MLKPAALLVLAAACAAAQTTRMSAEEISSRIREQLEAKGVRLPDVLRTVERSRERPASPKAKSGTKGAEEDPDAEAITRIANTYRRIYKIYQTVGALDSMPDLYVNTEPVINAYAADGQEIHMYLALSELLQDSDSELAFVLGHEMGHIVQQRTGRFLFVYDNEEFDADVWARWCASSPGMTRTRALLPCRSSRWRQATSASLNSLSGRTRPTRTNRS